jgi:hypothetical protein
MGIPRHPTTANLALQRTPAAAAASSYIKVTLRDRLHCACRQAAQWEVRNV